MQSKLKETFVINLIIIFILVIIGGYSQKESVSVLAQYDNKPIYQVQTEQKTISLMINTRNTQLNAFKVGSCALLKETNKRIASVT